MRSGNFYPHRRRACVRALIGRFAPVGLLLLGAAGVVVPSAFAQSLSINDVTVSEAAGSATFTISLDAPAPGTITVDWATLDGTALAGQDFTGAAPATVTFQLNDLTKTIVVPILEDALYEATEGFSVRLTNASGATIADNSGAGAITDNDPVPAIGFTVAAAGAFEGTPVLSATVQLSAAASTAISIPFAVSGTASNPADYGITPSPLVIPAGATSGSIDVAIVNDLLDEADETVIVTISPPVASPFVILTWTGTIFDNDAAPGLSITDATIQEGDSAATVAVTLSAPSGLTVSVDAFTQNGTAVAGQDFAATGTTTLVFQPGETVKLLAAGVLDDAVNEPTETFTINLNNAVNAAISRATGTVTIYDNDGPPAISVGDVTIPEGGGSGSFLVTLSSPSQFTITVNCLTQDGTAVGGLDYTPLATTQVTFSPGQTNRLVAVTVLDDAAVESLETFNLLLSGAANATIADDTGVGRITDNDAFYTSDFARFMDLPIQSGNPVGQFYSVGFTVDTAALVAGGQAKADGSDLAVAWDSTGGGNWIEIDAHLRPAPNATLATSGQTQIWFAIHEPAGITIPWVNRYRLYYTNPLAVPAVRRRDPRQVYRLFDDFSGNKVNQNVWYVHPSYKPAITVSGGMLHQNGNLSPGAIWQGSPIRMVTQTAQNVPTFSVSYNQAYAGECRFRSLNIADDIRPVNTLMHMPPPGFPSAHDEYTFFLHGTGTGASRLVRVKNGAGAGLFSSNTGIQANTWYDLKTTARLTVATQGQQKALHQVFLNGVLVGDSAAAPRGGFDAAITTGQVGIETDPGAQGDYDWFLIRDFTSVEPVVVPVVFLTLNLRQTSGGTQLDWSDPGGAQSFDVIRGQVGYIRSGTGGLDLGPVSCLEEDSADRTTGPDHLDTALPAPGSAFFYLVRPKTAAGNGPWGTSTGGESRTAPDGDCF